MELARDQYTTLGWGWAVPVKCVLNIHTFQALDNGFAVNKQISQISLFYVTQTFPVNIVTTRIQY